MRDGRASSFIPITEVFFAAMRNLRLFPCVFQAEAGTLLGPVPGRRAEFTICWTISRGRRHR